MDLIQIKPGYAREKTVKLVFTVQIKTNDMFSIQISLLQTN